MIALSVEPETAW